MTSNGSSKHEAGALLATWIVLVSLTLGSFWLADSGSRTSATHFWLLGFAALKSHLIVGVFMELRRGPLAWALAMSGFLLAEAALILAIHP